MIAIIGWGSLIWKPDGLPYDGLWRTGGPVLPLEFSKITTERPLTLVLDSINGVACPTRYTWSSRTTLVEAIEDLKSREGATEEQIGYIDLHLDQSSIAAFPQQIDIDASVRQWCQDNQISSVIWTAIPPDFTKRLGVEFSVEAVIHYLKELPDAERESVLEYIRNTPAEIDTPVRQRVNVIWQLHQEVDRITP